MCGAISVCCSVDFRCHKHYSILSSEREHDSVVMPLLRPPHMLGRVQITSRVLRIYQCIHVSMGENLNQ